MSCGTTVGNALRGVEGVEKAEASFEKANATVWFSTKKVLVNDLIEAAEAMGFGAELDEDINYPQIVLTVSGMKCQVVIYCFFYSMNDSRFFIFFYFLTFSFLF